MKWIVVAVMMLSSVAMANWDLYQRVRFHNLTIENTYGCRHIADEYHVYMRVASEDGERAYDVQVAPTTCKKILKKGMKIHSMEGAQKISENEQELPVYIIDMIELETTPDMTTIFRM